MQKKRWRKASLVSLVMATMLVTTACGGASQSASNGSGDNGSSTGPIKIGVITSKSGPVESYGTQEINGLKLGIEYATGGTNKVEGRDIQLDVINR